MCGVVGEGYTLLSMSGAVRPQWVTRTRDQPSIRIDTYLNIIEETRSPRPLVQMNRLGSSRTQ